MNRFAARFFLLIFPSLAGLAAWAQSPQITPASDRSATSTPKVAGVPQLLFSAIPLSTHSEQVRHLLESSIDLYENAGYRESQAAAARAAEADPQSALAFAMGSFAARRIMPDGQALAKAKLLLSHASPDEQLLARWMIGIQDRDLLPAISSMNDLLKRFPLDKHILYMTGEWLLLEQNDDRARAMLESALEIDPAFPAALNRLGYIYIGLPDPAKAIASLKRYAEVNPSSPNPQDSLAEISRLAGDDAAALEHYAAALKLNPKFINSQEGLGGTRALMGDYNAARHEYDLAIDMADNPSDELDAKCQKALTYFWEGSPTVGRTTFEFLVKEAAEKKEPNGQFEVLFARAMLAPDSREELSQLGEISAFLDKPLTGMNESDREVNRALVFRERVRVGSQNGLLEKASDALSQLEALATSSRDTVVMNAYESARGYLLAQKGDLAAAAEGLSADSHSPLALQRLAFVQEKLGDTAGAQATRNRLKFQRAPTVEWFLASQQSAGSDD